MAGRTIPSLDVYGAIDESKLKKDLFEIAKNTGTYGTPDYDTGASRKLTLEQLASNIVTEGVGLIREVVPISYIANPSARTADNYETETITDDDDYKYFIFSVYGRYQTLPYSDSYVINLPTAPRDGFCIFARFDTNGASWNNFDDYAFASGYTYLITWDSTSGVWLYDRQKSLGARPEYIFLGGSNSLRQVQINAPNVYYIGCYATYADYLEVTLPPLDFAKGDIVEFILINDSTSSQRWKFKPYSGDVIANANNGTSYSPPLGIKKGTRFSFRAVRDTTTDSAVILTAQINGWFVENENIII
jgi:hypothetical protein